MLKDWKVWLGTVFSLVGGTLLCYGYNWPWYAYALSPLAAVLFYALINYQNKSWDKAIAHQEKLLEISRLKLEATEKAVAKGEEILALQDEELHLLQADGLNFVDPLTVNQKVLNKVAAFYFRLLDKDGTTVH